MFRKILIGFMLLGAATQTFAAGNSAWGTIEDLYFGTAGDYVRVTMTVSDSQSFCGEANKPYILYLDQTDDVTKDFYKTRTSILLTAFVAKKQVRFWLVNNDCSPQNEPKIHGLNIKD